MDPRIIFKITALILYSLSAVIAISLLIVIYIHSRPIKAKVSMVLLCNTYLNLFLVSAIIIMMNAYAIDGSLNPSKPVGGRWCELRTYLSYVFFGALFYSFTLQALFRLFRIVFHRRKYLQSFTTCMVVIMIQWLIALLAVLPNLLLGDFEVLPNEQNCPIAFNNIRGQGLVTLNVFNNPLSILVTIYVYIIRYTRRPTAIQQQRQNSNQRDLAVLKRIIIVFLITASIGTPTTAVIFISLITNYRIPFLLDIQGLCTSLSIFVACVGSMWITPQTQQMFKLNRNQVHAHVSPVRAAPQTQVTHLVLLQKQNMK